MAKKTTEGNPRIELTDGIKLAQYYRMAYEKAVPEGETSKNQDSKICPRCGGTLVLKTAHKGEHAGQQFWDVTAQRRERGRYERKSASVIGSTRPVSFTGTNGY